jgi:hypothetical protein
VGVSKHAQNEGKFRRWLLNRDVFSTIRYCLVHVYTSLYDNVWQIEGKPLQYGVEYHGIKSKEDASKLLGSEDGNYLVRTTHNGCHILSFM